MKHSVTRDFRIKNPQLVEDLEKLDASMVIRTMRYLVSYLLQFVTSFFLIFLTLQADSIDFGRHTK